ncbi:MAG: outer membrane protein transport protein [Holophagae bacterium]
MIATNRGAAFLLVAVLVAAPSLSFGSGFALFEHGNRGMAMAGAMTAVADDPSALFWNPGGMAFQTDKGIQLMLGVTFISPTQTFYGESPYPGTGYEVDQEDQTFTPVHLYLGIPVNERLEVSFTLNNPWGLGTQWEDDHLGRYISRRAELQSFNFGISMAYQLSDRIGFGLGVDYIYSSLELTQAVGLINPFNQRLTDVADAEIKATDLGNNAFSWNVGLLAKLGKGFSVGAMYRSGFKLDYEGEGRLTQVPTGYPEFDGLVAGIFPFDGPTPASTSIEFPDFWTVGLSWQNEKWTFSGQYGVMGWSSFDQLAVVFPENPLLSRVVREDYEDAAQVRIGGEFRASKGFAIQLGWLFDETGQPIASMSPLLGDGDRTGYCGGISFMGKIFRVDIGYMHLDFDARSTEGTAWDGYDGRYEGMAELAGATLTFTF